MQSSDPVDPEPIPPEQAAALLAGALPVAAQGTLLEAPPEDRLRVALELALRDPSLRDLIESQVVETRKRPLIETGQRSDWNTPPEAMVPVYETYQDDRVDLDPCSNRKSIVRAREAIYLPEGASDTDPSVGGLAIPWHRVISGRVRGLTVFKNPPFGRETLPLWIDKAIAEPYAHTVSLVPSYTSAAWFYRAFETAAALCLWGKPGESKSRLKFLGAKDSAGFAVAHFCWSPDLGVVRRFLQAFDRVGKVIPLYEVRALIRKSCTAMDLPEIPDLFAHAEARARAARYNALLIACEDLRAQTLGDLLASSAGELKQAFASLTLGEILDGLALLAGNDSEAALPAAPSPDDRQLAIPVTGKPGDQEEREARDQQIVSLLHSVGPRGLARGEIAERVPATPSQMRSALKRLRDRGEIALVGSRAKARYHHADFAPQPPEEAKEQEDASRTTRPRPEEQAREGRAVGPGGPNAPG